MGIIVIERRNHIGIVKLTKPCITTCPAIVPTTVDDRPDATNEIPNKIEAALPITGVNVLYAVSISAIS